MNVTLTENVGKFTKRYRSSPRTIGFESLQLLEGHSLKIKALRALLLEGKNSPLVSGKKAMENIRKNLLERYGV